MSANTTQATPQPPTTKTPQEQVHDQVEGLKVYVKRLEALFEGGGFDSPAVDDRINEIQVALLNLMQIIDTMPSVLPKPRWPKSRPDQTSKPNSDGGVGGFFLGLVIGAIVVLVLKK